MELYHIVAVAIGGVIGKNNQLPWHFSSDLKHFKKITMGSTVIMGRKTFESIGSQPLPGRENFVLSRAAASPNNQTVKFFSSFEEALKEVRTQKAFIIGGASLFRQTLPSVDGIYLTQIPGTYEGDVYYPEIPDYFEEISREKSKEHPSLEFIFYRKTRKTALPPAGKAISP